MKTLDMYYKRKYDVSCDDQRNIREKRDEVNVGEEREVNIGGGITEMDVENERDVGVEDERDIGLEVEDERDENNVDNVRCEFDIEQLPSDPGLRILIKNYDVNVRDVIRRTYIQRGPCQPRLHEFPTTKISGKDRRFCVSWYNEYPIWLEYSIAKDAVFCFYCYLFNSSGGSFGGSGLSNWKKKINLKRHVAKRSSAHNQAREQYESFKKQEQSIQTCLNKQSQQARNNYRVRLNASIDCIRFLLRQGIAFRGHDESEESNNRGNFLELLHWLCDHNPEIHAIALKNAPENLKLTSPSIQKEIVSAVASEIVDVVMKDIGDGFFSILVDESRDISVKEQMSFVFRYVKNGRVLERFVGITHVASTTALSLKAAIDQFFSRHSLSISKLRGQGYDGANNMRGEYNGLKALILKENPSAYYIHCFAHQLQLALVAVAKKHAKIETFFTLVERLVTVVGGSAKRCDIVREKQRLKVVEAINLGEISSGQGLNQETSLKRPGDTRWGSHYGCLINLIAMFSTTAEVVEMISTDPTSNGSRGDACILVESMLKFEFAFNLHLMRKILGISNELSKALQRKDQDIVNAMSLVKVCKQQLQTMREDGWDSFFEVVCHFCEGQEIRIPNMDDMFVSLGRSRRLTVTNLHHFRVEMFYAVIDMQLQELNDRFSEVNSDLLICVACLCPNNYFVAFDKNKLIRLCKYYPKDFEEADILELEDQLDTYIIDMRRDEDFGGLHGISDLAQQMVVKNKHQVYPIVYKLLTLALVLPVATASVERVFSAMNSVKNRLRNRIGDQWLSDSLIAYVEKDIFDTLENGVIIERFQNMKTRREYL